MDERTPLDGDEVFGSTDLTVLDFWRWAMPDLQMNNVRGYLAEFLVARAVGAHSSRVEWDAYDVLSPRGTRIEVKSRGHVQSWPQPGGHRLGSFRVTETDGWDHASGTFLGKGWHADVYVLAVHTSTDRSSYDQLATDQWQFYVVSRDVVVERAGRSMSVGWLRENVGPSVGFAKLRAAIEEASIGRGSSPEM